VQDPDPKPKFNHDLLVNLADQDLARELYPSVFNSLYDPDLIDYFKQFDDRANEAKRKSRRLGTRAILLGGAAIALAAIDVAIRVFFPGEVSLLLLIGSAAAACGLWSAALGALGMLFGQRKHEWLINRFMGERIRQFHFQSLIAQLSLILAMPSTSNGQNSGTNARAGAKVRDGSDKPATTNPAQERFLDARHRRLIGFKAAFDELGREAKFGVTVGPGGEANWSLCDVRDAPVVPGSDATLQSLFAAYRELRIQHQLDYANYKLTKDSKIFSDMPRQQSELLQHVSKFGIAFVVAVHLCVLLIIAFSLFGWLFLGHPAGSGTEMAVTGIFSFAIIALAVVSLCAHAFSQGLQPEREVERYQQYGSALNSILMDFDSADDPLEKIKVMKQMERVAFTEMRNFLITHHERSSFAM
jgi:hypothetical protein